jgi:hypothetical protein
MGDHQVGATGVTNHDDGVVDRRPNAGGLQRKGGMSELVHQGGWAKCEAKAVCGMDEGTDSDVGALAEALVPHVAKAGAQML